MQKAVYFILVSLLLFASCKKDASNPVNTDTVPTPPSLTSPTDTSSNIAVPVVLTWKESSGAKSYTLQVSASSSFSSFIFNKSDITTTTQQVPDLNYLAVYYWRVSATNSAGTSDWSKVWSFTTTKDEPALIPQLSLPANGAVNQKFAPVLTWNKVNNANRYAVQLSTNSSFTNFVFDEDSLTATTKQITDLSGSTQYYWRVSATNSFGTKGWSETWSFTTGVAPVSPVLVSPSDGAIDVALSTTLTWNASSGATSYILQVSTSSSFSSFVFNQSVTTISKQITGLTYSTKYYWRVLSTNNYGTSIYSGVWSFTTGVPPTPPTLLTPIDGATDVAHAPTFTWDSCPNATSYILQVAKDNSFTNTIYNNNVGNITSKQITGLSWVTKYYWRLSASNSIGVSNPSVVRTFTTTINGPCTSAPTVTYEGKTYNTIQIGVQCWMKENLDVGTMILGSANASNNGTIEKYCYDNNAANCAIYGGLYQWNEAMSYSVTAGTKGICPTGWHIPTKAEFETLAATVSNDGNALKAIGQGTGSGAGTNTSGFFALLAGCRYSNINFIGLGDVTKNWISTADNASSAYHLWLDYSSNGIDLYGNSKEYGFSIRCLKD